MALFSTNSSTGRVAALVDIGSGSVGVALVYSDPLTATPEIIWSHREHMRINDESSLENTQKRLTTALVNAFMILGESGIAALRNSAHSSKIKNIQLTISAPWSYTITKVVSFTDDTPFTFNEALLKQLVTIAQEKVTAELSESNTLVDLNLEIITQSTVNIEADGYQITEASGQTVHEVSIARINSLAQAMLMERVTEARDKIIPEAHLNSYSFMSIYYQVAKELTANTTELCLVDITREATEIGIVRNGILRYTTHIPFGSFSLAREIALALNTTNEDGYSYLKDNNEQLMATLPSAKTDELMTIFEKYETRLAELFTRTGDSLSIPKLLIINTEQLTSDFFTHRITKSAEAATKTTHHVEDIKELGQTKLNSDIDPALQLAALFFHNQATD